MIIRFVIATAAVLAAITTGVVTLLTFGVIPAALAILVVIIIGAVAVRRPRGSSRTAARVALSVLLLLVTTYALSVGMQLSDAFTDLSDPVEPADPQAVASARQKLEDDVADNAAFNIELTEAEVTALVQDQLQALKAPFRRVLIDIVDDDTGGHIDFTGIARNNTVTMKGRLNVVLDSGIVRFDLLEAEAGSVRMPGIAKGFVEDLINPFTRKTLTDSGAEIQSVELGNDRLSVTGSQPGGTLLSSSAILAELKKQAASSTAINGSLVLEQFGPGDVNGREAQGDIYYVALGDSLAANVGVNDAREGYVSRFHRQLQTFDAKQYGLRNFGIAGETSSSLISTGQLDDAIAFIRTHRVAYITVNIGANDVLGHLASRDCEEGLSAVACRTRLEDAFVAFANNLRHIFRHLRDVAPDTQIVFLTTYNPFSMGFESDFEAETNHKLTEFNELAAALAERFGVRIADGFTSMEGTAATTTHMLDSRSDIHPNAPGYDLLTGALMDALK